MCFHASRLDSKTNAENEILDLKHQDRTLWYKPLIHLGHVMMEKAVDTSTFSCYHYEAAIAAEHLQAPTFESTDWDKIHYWHQQLNTLQPMPIHVLNMAVVCIQKQDYSMAKTYLDDIKPEDLEQRAYLFYGTKADYYLNCDRPNKAIHYLNLALETVNNTLEKDYLQKKLTLLTSK